MLTISIVDPIFTSQEETVQKNEFTVLEELLSVLKSLSRVMNYYKYYGKTRSVVSNVRENGFSKPSSNPG